MPYQPNPAFVADNLMIALTHKRGPGGYLDRIKFEKVVSDAAKEHPELFQCICPVPSYRWTENDPFERTFTNLLMGVIWTTSRSQRYGMSDVLFGEWGKKHYDVFNPDEQLLIDRVASRLREAEELVAA